MNVLAAMNEHTWWWLSRATGMVAWALSVAAIVWGLTLSGRVVRRKRLPAWLLDLHKYLGTLTLAFVAVHMGALTLDNYVAVRRQGSLRADGVVVEGRRGHVGHRRVLRAGRSSR